MQAATVALLDFSFWEGNPRPKPKPQTLKPRQKQHRQGLVLGLGLGFWNTQSLKAFAYQS